MEGKFVHNKKLEYEQKIEFKTFLDTILDQRRFAKVLDFDVEYALTKEPVPFAERKALPYVPLHQGEVWSKEVFDCAWFHLRAVLPESVSREHLFLSFDCEGEGLLVDKEGSALKGFTNGTWNFGGYNYPAWSKTKYPLDGLINEKGEIDLWIDCGSNRIQGDFHEVAHLLDARLVRENEATSQVYYRFAVYLDLARNLDPEDPELRHFLDVFNHVRALYEFHDPDADEKALAALDELRNAKLPKDDFSYYAIGHSHLDLVWLWPERETKRKLLRTFANVVYLMGKYPEYTFAVSQPRQVEWLKEEDPKLFAEVKKYVMEGRIDILGGGYVENDTNLVSEESMVHQELYGQKFWLENFGRYTHVRWLPDTFGYNGANPQVFALSEQPYFMTIKISWSRYTVFPYHTFHWEGIDGTSVLAHMPPDNDYNSTLLPTMLFLGEKNMKPCDGKPLALTSYGIGDGGGGPGEVHMETYRVEKDLPYLPKIKMGLASDFYPAIDGQKDLPTHKGEMYLERHQGTYTSQSQNKQHNREFEEKMKSLEFLLACESVHGEKAEMDHLWKDGLLYQFHDCLPGSSIHRVNVECDERYAQMFAKMESIAEDHGASFEPKEGKKLWNHLGYGIRHLEKKGDVYWLYEAKPGEAVSPSILPCLGEVKSNVLEGEKQIVAFAEDGHIDHVYSKALKRNILEEGNHLRVFEDVGDAWDFREMYRDQVEQYMHLDSRFIKDYGKFYEVTSVYSFKESRVKETMLVLKQEEGIYIQHDVSWKNLGYMLRAENRPSVYSPVVHNDIQFGTLDRSTEEDTEQHAAQFEMCCQKWMDISSESQGVAILNRARDGYYAKRGLISYDLLRSTNYPDTEGDLKPTTYRYAILPHAGGYDPIKLDELGMELNARFLYVDETREIPTVDNAAVEVSAYKPSYDDEAYVVRLYEKSGKATSAHLHLPKGKKIVGETNLLEDVKGPAPDGEIAFHPYQIRTFLVK